MPIRKATPEDSQSAVNVLIRSITEGCVQDHQNDQTILNGWLLNKKEENFLSWLSNPNNVTLVSVDPISDAINGVGLISKTGTVKLLYVLPELKRKGIGTQLFESLQQAVIELGVTEITLDSTSTGKHFYEKQGFIPKGQPFKSQQAVICHPMVKSVKFR